MINIMFLFIFVKLIINFLYTMIKIEQGASTDTFKINGIDYTKGIYEMYYQNNTIFSDNTTDYDKLEIGLVSKHNQDDVIAEAKKITDWVNSLDVPYSDYTTLINDLTTFIL